MVNPFQPWDREARCERCSFYPMARCRSFRRSKSRRSRTRLRRLGRPRRCSSTVVPVAAKITFDTVKKIGLALPGVEEATMYGSPALKLGGKLMACIAVHQSAEPDTLAVRTDFAEREELLAT